MTFEMSRQLREPRGAGRGVDITQHIDELDAPWCFGLERSSPVGVARVCCPASGGRFST